MLQELTLDLSGMNGNWVGEFVDLAGDEQILPGVSQNGGGRISCSPRCCYVPSLLALSFVLQVPAGAGYTETMPYSTASRTRNWTFLPKCQTHVLPVNLTNCLSTAHVLFPLETKYLAWHLPVHGLHSRSCMRCCTVKRIPWPKKWKKFSKLSLPLEDSWHLLAKKSS